MTLECKQQIKKIIYISALRKIFVFCPLYSNALLLPWVRGSATGREGFVIIFSNGTDWRSSHPKLLLSYVTVATPALEPLYCTILHSRPQETPISVSLLTTQWGKHTKSNYPSKCKMGSQYKLQPFPLENIHYGSWLGQLIWLTALPCDEQRRIIPIFSFQGGLRTKWLTFWHRNTVNKRAGFKWLYNPSAYNLVNTGLFESAYLHWQIWAFSDSWYIMSLIKQELKNLV